LVGRKELSSKDKQGPKKKEEKKTEQGETENRLAICLQM
jgi:hypothetical protein